MVHMGMRAVVTARVQWLQLPQRSSATKGHCSSQLTNRVFWPHDMFFLFLGKMSVVAHCPPAAIAQHSCFQTPQELLAQRWASTCYTLNKLQCHHDKLR